MTEMQFLSNWVWNQENFSVSYENHSFQCRRCLEFEKPYHQDHIGETTESLEITLLSLFRDYFPTPPDSTFQKLFVPKTFGICKFPFIRKLLANALFTFTQKIWHTRYWSLHKKFGHTWFSSSQKRIWHKLTFASFLFI